MTDIFAKIPVFSRKSERELHERKEFYGLFGKEGAKDVLSSASLENFPLLKPEKPLTLLLNEEQSPKDIRRIGEYDNRVFILNMEGGNFGFYYYEKGNAVKKTYTTVETYHYLSDGREIFKNLVFTRDKGDTVGAGEKLLLFPMKKYVNLETGTVEKLPDIVPPLKFATVMGGRLFGVDGNDLWISGAKGCFDWKFDGPDDKNPEHAFLMRFTTSAEGEQPVTALVSYRGNVYIFRKNKIQRIEGKGTPYNVRDLYRVGTKDMESVKEIEGKLYFISENSLYELNGSSMKNIITFPKDMVLEGISGVVHGSYATACKKDGKNFLLFYYPETDSFGIMETAGEVLSFAKADGKEVVLLKKDMSKQLYTFRERTFQDYFLWSFSLPHNHIGETYLKEISVEGTLLPQSELEMTLEIERRNGATFRYPLGKFSEAGPFHFQKKAHFPKGVSAKLNLLCYGDFSLESLLFVNEKSEGSS